MVLNGFNQITPPAPVGFRVDGCPGKSQPLMEEVMTIEFEVATIIQASPQQLYDAWLDSATHTQMTGATAEASAEPGAAFAAWDGYITGKNLELKPGERIVQAWRTTEFSASAPDSRLEILFTPAEEGTRVTIRHSGLPDHGMQYKSGWVENYFIPMKAHFEYGS